MSATLLFVDFFLAWVVTDDHRLLLRSLRWLTCTNNLILQLSKDFVDVLSSLGTRQETLNAFLLVLIECRLATLILQVALATNNDLKGLWNYVVDDVEEGLKLV